MTPSLPRLARVRKGGEQRGQRYDRSMSPRRHTVRAALVAALLGLGLAGAVAAGAGAATPKPKKPAAPKPLSPAAVRAADLKAGGTLFMVNGCGACHTLAGARVDGAKAPDLDVLGLPAAEIVRQLTKGSISMPSFKGRLTTKQIAQLAGYIAATAKAKERRPRDAVSLVRGYCGMCHALASAGARGVTAAPLDAKPVTAQEVVNAIVQKHPLSMGFGLHLEGDELQALADYVSARAPQAAAAGTTTAAAAG